MDQYLQSSTYIDWKHSAVSAKAAELSGGSALDVAKRCFEFVRDEVSHSWDSRRNPVTCKASDVLHYGTGYCYAKSHLLAALLRANGIPAGLCYQRLVLEPGGAQYSLHGLNALYLPPHGWYRVDPRGNKPGVSAQFSPPIERLAFAVGEAGERDFDSVLAEPLPVVINALTRYKTIEEVAEHLPDLDAM